MLGERGVQEQWATITDYAMWELARVMQWSLHKCYGVPDDSPHWADDVDVPALFAAVVAYPARPSIALGSLVRSHAACYEFMRELYPCK